MTLIDRINRFISVHLEVLKDVVAISVWWPLTLLFAVNLGILFALNNVSMPLFMSPVMVWAEFLDLVFGTQNAGSFGRFPYHLYLLPDVFGWAKFLVSFFFEGLVLGLVAIKFNNRLGYGSSEKPSLLKLWPRFFLIWLVVNVLMILAGQLLPILFHPVLDGARRMFVFNTVVLPSVFVFILSLFMFSIPAAAIKGDSVLKALSRSLGIFVRNPFTCIFLAGLILLFPLFFSILAGYSIRIVQDFKPSLVVIIVACGLASEVAANFLWIGSTVRFLNDNREL